MNLANSKSGKETMHTTQKDQALLLAFSGRSLLLAVFLMTHLSANGKALFHLFMII